MFFFLPQSRSWRPPYVWPRLGVAASHYGPPVARHCQRARRAVSRRTALNASFPQSPQRCTTRPEDRTLRRLNSASGNRNRASPGAARRAGPNSRKSRTGVEKRRRVKVLPSGDVRDRSSETKLASKPSSPNRSVAPIVCAPLVNRARTDAHPPAPTRCRGSSSVPGASRHMSLKRVTVSDGPSRRRGHRPSESHPRPSPAWWRDLRSAGGRLGPATRHARLHEEEPRG